MCEFCTKHGEGKEWYLNIKNYNLDLLSDLKKKRFARNFFHDFADSYNKYPIYRLALNLPFIKTPLRYIARRSAMRKHWGQVLPIEDVKKVLSMTTSIVRVPCVCRKITTGKEVRSCFLVSIDPKLFEKEGMVDRSYFGPPDVVKFEKFGIDEALDFMKAEESNGAIHTIWTITTPLAGAICNCGGMDCLALKTYREVMPHFFKAEYIADVSIDRCVDCGECIKLCQFGALKRPSVGAKVEIDNDKCYGCGICRSVCSKKAITLKKRC